MLWFSDMIDQQNIQFEEKMVVIHSFFSFKNYNSDA